MTDDAWNHEREDYQVVQQVQMYTVVFSETRCTVSFISWQGKEIFTFLQNMQTSSGAHPASYSVGTMSSFSEGVRQLWNDGGHPFPEVKNHRSCTSTHAYMMRTGTTVLSLLVVQCVDIACRQLKPKKKRTWVQCHNHSDRTYWSNALGKCTTYCGMPTIT
jgi:hypothetical protein